MKIKSVKIEPGCISCGTCEACCPEVFEVKSVSTVKSGVNFDAHREEIKEAAEICPVGVITYEEE